MFGPNSGVAVERRAGNCNYTAGKTWTEPAGPDTGGWKRTEAGRPREKRTKRGEGRRKTDKEWQTTVGRRVCPSIFDIRHPCSTTSPSSTPSPLSYHGIPLSLSLITVLAVRSPSSSVYLFISMMIYPRVEFLARTDKSRMRRVQFYPGPRGTRGNNSRKVSCNWHARRTSPWIERGYAKFYIFLS